MPNTSQLMNIVFVNSTRKWGGVKTWVVDYATSLMERAHSVRVFGRQPEFIDKLKSVNVPATAVNFGFDYNPVTVAFFVNEFRKNRPDVVIGNIGKDINTAGVAARMLGIPVIQRVGLHGDMEYSLRLKLMHRAVNPWFLCPSDSVVNGMLKRLPYIDRKRVKVILNSKRPATAVKPVEEGPLQLVSTSQVNADKGHEQVLEALTHLPEQSVCYHIVGTGKLEDSLRAKYSALEESGMVVWHGFSTDVAGHLAKADVFLLPSKREGMPNALLEAMAAGLVPVARRVGGVPDIWPDSLSRYLIPFDAGSEAFREALESVLALSPGEVMALKEHSLAACRDGFNLHDKIDEFLHWLRDEVCAA